MGAAAAFWHRANVDRKRELDDTQGNTKASWDEDVLTDIPGRLVVKTQRLANTAFAEQPVITTYTWLCGKGRDIRAGDRLHSVVDARSGQAIEDGTFSVQSVIKRRTSSARHQSLILEKIG